jgi:DNA-binding MarR family transcriptional regulator
LLRTLYDVESKNPSHLATELGMTKGAITKIVDRLADRKLVLRRADPHDRRAQSVSLTAAGASLVPELAELADQNDKEHFGSLSASDRKNFFRLLRQLVRDAKIKTVPTE